MFPSSSPWPHWRGSSSQGITDRKEHRGMVVTCFFCQFIAIPYGLLMPMFLMQDLHPNPLTPDPNDMRTRNEETSLELCSEAG